MIPTLEECLDLMKEHNMLENIVHHSLLVNEVGLWLSEELNKTGENIDLAKVQAGALLHDITKTKSITTGEDHAKTGSELLEKLGFESISEIVRQHVMTDDALNSPTISEIEIVNYADKRVLHSKVVTLRKRFDDLRTRYGINQERVYLISQSEKRAIEVEKKIFSKLDVTPDVLLSITIENYTLEPQCYSRKD
ncbi:MAG: metal-dependent phosphohydrolase [Deltaproteobacteria bacterium CG12_big_fil_rev_8_21_14_0_65_43_10]|nr:MAG: metal-dependent phosphohydrolase [Deltaproteobacteria bacterium CG12_big_fil_rev_8_21_14_0_65_43_10]PIU86435.1 MAG: metal-dependent phosphohydrolase [Deltaproteobacteria bacterium CG06_land_8_20_14_3_00_44_19]